MKKLYAIQNVDSSSVYFLTIDRKHGRYCDKTKTYNSVEMAEQDLELIMNDDMFYEALIIVPVYIRQKLS